MHIRECAEMRGHLVVISQKNTPPSHSHNKPNPMELLIHFVPLAIYIFASLAIYSLLAGYVEEILGKNWSLLGMMSGVIAMFWPIIIYTETVDAVEITALSDKLWFHYLAAICFAVFTALTVFAWSKKKDTKDSA